MNSSSYRTAIVGMGRMSLAHLEAIAATPRLTLAAICDTTPAALANAPVGASVARCTDIDQMMRDTRPDIVCVVTPNRSHAAITRQIASARPRAIICEKPMSVTFGDALAMAEDCTRAGVELLINHQRRLGAGAAGRAWIESGAIGELLEIEARCAGDFISDGTHAVDAALCLGGDRPAGGVYGAVFFDEKPRERYGHLSDMAGFANWHDDHSVRYTVNTGALSRRNQYQDWRVRGTRGELWHPGGKLQPQWYLRDGSSGDTRIELGPDRWFPIPVSTPEGGPWRKLPAQAQPNDLEHSLRLLVERLDGGSAPHPLRAEIALRVQEIVNAVYASALARRPVNLPLAPDAPFPMDALTTA